MVLNTTADDAAAPELTQWVVFHCAGHRYGIELECVIEILPPRPFTRLPGAGPEVCGLVSVRGRVVTVLDGGVLLGLPPAGSAAEYRLLLLEDNGRSAALAVEEVLEIARARIEVHERGADLARLGVGRSLDGEFTALDVSAVTRMVLT